MNLQIKIISGATAKDLERQVNQFLNELTEAQSPAVGNIVLSPGGYYVIHITYKSIK